MLNNKPGRHAPAFILLILSMGDNHGLGILKKMDEIAVGHRLDTAVVYRVLKKMQEEGLITSCWEKSEAGPKKKVYSITESGADALKVYKNDIEGAVSRLSSFLNLYKKL